MAALRAYEADILKALAAKVEQDIKDQEDRRAIAIMMGGPMYTREQLENMTRIQLRRVAVNELGMTNQDALQKSSPTMIDDIIAMQESPPRPRFNRNEYTHSLKKLTKKRLIEAAVNAAENANYYVHEVDRVRHELEQEIEKRDASARTLKEALSQQQDRLDEVENQRDWWKQLALKYAGVADQLLAPYAGREG